MRTTRLLVLAVLSAFLINCGGGGDSSSTGDTTKTDNDNDGILNAVDNCPNDANASQRDSDLNGEGDACDALPTKYVFVSKLTADASAVSYSGQTKRHLLIDRLNAFAGTITDDGSQTTQDVIDSLDFYLRFDGGTSDDQAHGKTLVGGEPLVSTRYGDISSGKDLVGKLAGNDPALLDDEFFGWEDGAPATPESLVDSFVQRLAAEATNNSAVTVETAEGNSVIDTTYIDAAGRDYQQLIQKFLLGAVAFSQGTADYFQTDWATENIQESTSAYTASEHNWDEAFGYFGAARDYADYTDDEIRAGGSDLRGQGYDNGYADTNGDGSIDLKSEFNFGNATNCAKRDAGAQVATNFTQDVFEAFVAGRQILNNGVGETFTAEQLTALTGYAKVAAVTWEKCIASTVVHYINDVIADMGEFDNGQFADADNFITLAKHWSEMKGFALGLQFSPFSPFRDSAFGSDVNDLKIILSLMGDAPVLADGSQNGEAFTGGAPQYINDLEMARDLLQEAYSFEEANVQSW